MRILLAITLCAFAAGAGAQLYRWTDAPGRVNAENSLFPFARYERLDTQSRVPAGYARNPENDATIWTVGVAFKPIEQLVFKADWQRRENRASTGVNQWNAALGYVF